MKKTFWDRNAGLYDSFMRKDTAAYEQMYALIRLVVRHKTVLELATGTGLIARHIVSEADHIEATDASPEMIAHKDKLCSPFRKRVPDPNAPYDAYDESDDTEQKAKAQRLPPVGR